MRTPFFLLFLALVASVEAGRPQPFADKDFVSIPPGEFQMGCTVGDDACEDYERPSHPVRITRAFQLQAHQVTEGQWKDVAGRNPIFGKPFTAHVSWDDVQLFLKKLNGKKDGYQYRLPTEAEWEFAARNETRDMTQSTPLDFSQYGEGTGYAGGGSRNDILILSKSRLRQLKQGKCYEGQAVPPCPQSSRPNARGLYDMMGRTGEWVQDWLAPYSAGLQIDPEGPQLGTEKTVRGFIQGAQVPGMAYPPSRVSYRMGWDTFSYGGYEFFGFRCVREPQTK